jgi:hypothetical protein
MASVLTTPHKILRLAIFRGEACSFCKTSHHFWAYLFIFMKRPGVFFPSLPLKLLVGRPLSALIVHPILRRARRTTRAFRLPYR